MMPIRVPVEVICQPVRSGYGDEDVNEFVLCVNGRVPQIHKLWSFAEGGITCEVHPFAHVDVDNFSRDLFQTYYIIEEDCRVTIFSRRCINVSVKWLGTPVPFYDTTGVDWIDNIMFPELRLGDGGNYNTWALQTQSGVSFRGRGVRNFFVKRAHNVI